MKKNLLLAVFVLISLMLTACEKNTAMPTTPAPPIMPVGTPSAQSEADIDLPRLGTTMMVAMIENIYAAPESYMGQTIKMGGNYYSTYFEGMDVYFHYVLFTDEGSCCSYGFIFEYDGEYPEEEAEIEVIGVLSRGQAPDTGEEYYYLAVDELR
ncbi:MAG: hypothetical protein FWG87_05165 [Defluviitaleaceae bacterium]|nr:hypothetical protein [Defluviitaleaceae bacterium]